MRNLNEQVRILELLRDVSTDEIAEILAGEKMLKCEKCILDVCKGTFGKDCKESVKMYIKEGRQW